VNDVNDHADQWDGSHDDADEWERSRDHRQLATRSRIRDHSIELFVIFSWGEVWGGGNMSRVTATSASRPV